jgi:hypothetical protein
VNTYIDIVARRKLKSQEKNMNEIDGLKEVCETAQVVQTGEQDIATIEKQIADKMRSITAKIFDGTTKYRMRKILIDDSPYWAFGVMLKDDIQFNGSFVGTATLIRVSTNGRIQTISQYVPGTRQYDLNEGVWSIGSYDDQNRVSTDHEIATHAAELAKELLEALRTRIDTMKTEKATLQKVAQAIS